MTQAERLALAIEEMVNDGSTLPQITQSVEDGAITSALKMSGGKVTRAARRLGIHRNTLHSKRRRA